MITTGGKPRPARVGCAPPGGAGTLAVTARRSTGAGRRRPAKYFLLPVGFLVGFPGAASRSFEAAAAAGRGRTRSATRRREAGPNRGNPCPEKGGARQGLCPRRARASPSGEGCFPKKGGRFPKKGEPIPTNFSPCIAPRTKLSPSGLRTA